MRSLLLGMLALVACAGGSVQEVDRTRALPDAAGPPASPTPELPPAPPPPVDETQARVKVELQTYVDADLRALISTEARHFRTCYAEALGRNPDVRGTMEVQLTLAAGRPADAERVAVDQTGDWRLVACVEEALDLWAVPGGRDGAVAFTLRFSRRA